MTVQNSVPGYRTGRTTIPRNILASGENIQLGRGWIDATFSFDGGNVSGQEQELRPGVVMAKITATGLWMPCKRTQVNLADATVTALIVDDARHFQVNDTITVGADTALSVTAIDYATNTLTITSTAVLDNEVVFCDSAAQAGCEIARGILNQFIQLVDKDDNTARNRSMNQLVLHALVNQGMVLGDIAAIRAMSEGTTKFLGGIEFIDDKGQAAENQT